MNLLWPYLTGALAVGVGYLLAAGFTWQWDPLRLAEGADGRLSVSKLQWLLWTAVVVFGYVATVVARSLNGGDITDGVTLPSNLLVAMGFSTATMATAKGITTMYIAGGRVVKPQSPSSSSAAPSSPGAAAASPGAAAASTTVAGGVAVAGSSTASQPPAASYLSDLVQDDSNQTDLSKVQLLVWTAIALGVFLANVVVNINAIKSSGTGGSASLPDIDAALMVLMGLSQGGYLGKKLVTSNRLQLVNVSPAAVSLAGERQITLFGSGFGAASPTDPKSPEDSGSHLTIGGYNATGVTAWSDTRIVATLSADPKTGDPAIAAFVAAASASQAIPVSVLVAGQVPRDGRGAPQSVSITVTP